MAHASRHGYGGTLLLSHTALHIMHKGQYWINVHRALRLAVYAFCLCFICVWWFLFVLRCLINCELCVLWLCHVSYIILTYTEVVWFLLFAFISFSLSFFRHPFNIGADFRCSLCICEAKCDSCEMGEKSYVSQQNDRDGQMSQTVWDARMAYVCNILLNRTFPRAGLNFWSIRPIVSIVIYVYIIFFFVSSNDSNAIFVHLFGFAQHEGSINELSLIELKILITSQYKLMASLYA